MHPTWFTLQLAAVLLVDEAGGQRAEEHRRRQEADGGHHARHHGPRQTLVHRLRGGVQVWGGGGRDVRNDVVGTMSEA